MAWPLALSPVRALAVTILALGALLAVAPARAVSKASRPAAAPLIPRELDSLAREPHALVQLTRPVDARAASLLRAAGGSRISERLAIWRVPSRAAQRLVPALALAGSLEEVQPDRALAAADHLTAGDPLLPREWWLGRVGADRVEPPGPGVPVTVIDSGLDLSHPEFSARPDTGALNAQTFAGRTEFHGTAVSSVVGAPANGVGIVGVYPRATLRSFDVSSDGGLRASEVIAGIDAAAAMGRGVVNISLGGTFRNPLEEEAVLDAFDRGLVVVSSVGNERENGSPASFPAGLPHVVTVAATDLEDRASAFSTQARAVDLAAPGEDIPVAVPSTAAAFGYVSVDGTSFSAPIVAGAAAWIWTVRPELDKTQLVELLRRTARDLGAPGRDLDTGFGLLDLPAALTAPAPASDPLEPNDDVVQVSAGGLFRTAKRALTAPGRGHASIAARLDSSEDPEDVYRAWLPPGRRLVATVRASRDADLQVWDSGTVTVHARGQSRRGSLLGQSAVRGSGRETVEVTNRTRAGRAVYVDVFLPASASLVDTGYTLTLTTAAPRARR